MKKANKDFQLPQEKAITAADFAFVERGTIQEQHFSTKPTSFGKDAAKRFAKNKGSLIAFVIIGILFLLALIVPIADQSDVYQSDIKITFLAPKWHGFEHAGFLDGGRDMKDVQVIKETGLPAGITDVKQQVIDEKITEKKKSVVTADVNAYGGTILVTPIDGSQVAAYNSPLFHLDFSQGDYDFNFDVLAKPDGASYELSEPQVLFVPTTGNPFALTTAVKDEGDRRNYSVDAAGFKSQIEAAIPGPVYPLEGSISLTTKVADGPSAGFQLAKFTATTTNAADADFAGISWSEGNEAETRTGAATWTSSNTAARLIGAYTHVADFRYDTYSKLREFADVISGDDMQSYIDKGWAIYTWGQPESFKLTPEGEKHCPVVSVQNEEHGDFPIDYYALNVTSVYYKKLGYTSEPYYFFGTNQNGLDYFKLVFTGLRTSLLLGILVTLLCLIIGIVWGSVSAYFGGWTDIIMSRVTDIMGGVPWIVVVTICVLLLKASFGVFLLALVLIGWITVANNMRRQVYRYKGREYVMASRTLGASDARLITKHIVPNAIGPIVTSAVLMIPNVIFSEAVVSYLGLGLKGFISLGVTISDAQNYLQQYPYLTISSSLVIALLMICFNLFGNGLRDAFNPSLKGSGQEV